jgi:hypothetical protein
MEDTKKLLSNEFEMSNLRSFHVCLGMEILYDKKLGILSINQQRYIEEKILQRYNMQSCNSTIILMEAGLKLSKKNSPQTKEEKAKMVNIPYQNAVGSLMHAMVNTRHGIAYVVNSVAQYLSNLGEKHWLVIKRILRYLKGTMGKGLIYRRTNTPLLL